MCCFTVEVRSDKGKGQCGRCNDKSAGWTTLNPGSILSRVKKLFPQNLQTNYGTQPALYPVGNWLLRVTNSRSVESTGYCNVMPSLRTGGGVSTWRRAELSSEGTFLSRIEGKNCEWKVGKAETN